MNYKKPLQLVVVKDVADAVAWRREVNDRGLDEAHYRVTPLFRLADRYVSAYPHMSKAAELPLCSAFAVLLGKSAIRSVVQATYDCVYDPDPELWEEAEAEAVVVLKELLPAAPDLEEAYSMAGPDRRKQT